MTGVTKLSSLTSDEAEKEIRKISRDVVQDLREIERKSSLSLDDAAEELTKDMIEMLEGRSVQD